jgi:hypothetical protein
MNRDMFGASLISLGVIGLVFGPTELLLFSAISFLFGVLVLITSDDNVAL